MICRHRSGDPACGSTAGGYQAMNNARYETESKLAEINQLRAKLAAMTPDSSVFEIEDTKQVGKHMVMKVSFPNCKSCAYEGNKVLVYLNMDINSVLKWRSLDPHFRASKSLNVKEAPPPDARFPASTDGWKNAVKFTNMLSEPATNFRSTDGK